MTAPAKACSTHRAFPTEAEARQMVQSMVKRLKGRYQAWKCGSHWHIARSKRSIWAVFDVIEAERAKAQKVAS